MKNKYAILLFLMLSSTFAFSQCIPNPSSILCNASVYGSINGNTNLLIDSNLTVEAWIYATQWQSIPSSGTIFCKHSWTGGGAQQGYVLRAGGSGQLSFNFQGLDSVGTAMGWQEILSPAAALNLNTWYHVAASFDGDSIRLYINANQVAVKAFHGTIYNNSVFSPKIGRLSDTGVGQTRNWYGNIDEVRVWNVTRTQSQLQANYNHQIDPLVQVGLKGYWRFNEGSGTSFADLSGSGNNGTITGSGFSTLVPFNQQAVTPIMILNGYVLSCFTTGTIAGYQWNVNGNPITGATLSTYTVTTNGTYSVTITDSSGCAATSNTYQITTLGLSENSIGSSIRIYQENGELVLLNQHHLKLQSVRIYDLQGKLICASTELSAEKKSLATGIHLNGIYFVQVEGESVNFSEKILIQE